MKRATPFLAAAALIAAAPIMAGDASAQRASKPGAVENQESDRPAPRSVAPKFEGSGSVPGAKPAVPPTDGAAKKAGEAKKDDAKKDEKKK